MKSDIGLFTMDNIKQRDHKLHIRNFPSRSPYSSFNRKRISSSRMSNSCTNINLNTSIIKSYKFPSVNSTTDSHSIVNSKNIPNWNQSMYLIENEKLWEEAMQYKIVVKALKKELSVLKHEKSHQECDSIKKDSEIEQLIQNHENENYLIEDFNSSLTQQAQGLIRKIKKQTKIIEREWQEEQNKTIELKSNPKITKSNENDIEKEIIVAQMHKTQALVENSNRIKLIQKNKIAEKRMLEYNVNTQRIWWNDWVETLKQAKDNEDDLQNNWIQTQKENEECDENFEKISNVNKALRKENQQLNTEKKKYRNIKGYSLTNYQLRWEELRSEWLQYKAQLKKSGKKINTLNPNKSHSQLKTPEQKQQNIIFNNYNNMQIIDVNNNKKEVPQSKEHQTDQDKIIKLKQLWETNKQREYDLEQELYQIHKQIKNRSSKDNNTITRNNDWIRLKNNDITNQSNTISMRLNEENPYYTNNETNEPMETKLFTNGQFQLFTYVLFKNFEAKKVDAEIASEKITNKVFDSTSSTVPIKEIIAKFVERTCDLLHCNNKKDKTYLEVFFSVICYNSRDCASNPINEYFLTWFSCIQKYTDATEGMLKKRLSETYKNEVTLLYNLAVQLGKDSKSNYISFMDWNKIIVETPKVEMPDEYIEFIFYFMKQFDDTSASLFDLRISKLKELIKEVVLNADDNRNKSNDDNAKEDRLDQSGDSIEEITKDRYDKAIDEALAIIAYNVEKENTSLRELLKESIVRITSPLCDVITIESFHDELSKLGVSWTDTQLWCIYNKYCVNDDLRAWSIDQIGKDIGIITSSLE